MAHAVSYSLAYAKRDGLIEEKHCLGGMILNEIVDWTNGTDSAAPRIFWLHGQRIRLLCMLRTSACLASASVSAASDSMVHSGRS